MARHPDKKNVELSLKYGTFVPGFGLMKVVSGEVLDVADGSFLLNIDHIFIGHKWHEVSPRHNWIEEDCVVSRTYVAPHAKQTKLAL